jgi:hypothetical protein
MGCCGKRSTMTAIPAKMARPSASSSPYPSFQYIGGSGLTVQGPASKRLYRFASPGAIVAVDARDAASLARMPQLRRM